MLGLNLREEFKGRRLKGTAIELSNQNKTGAIQVPAKQFLEITYPSGDVLNAVETVGPDSGRPVVLIGERELRVRSLLHRMGYRFSLRRKVLPGKPDVVLPKYKAVVFVHGCFWHQHPRCSKASILKTRERFWREKLMANVRRDKRVVRRLRAEDSRVLTVWECELRADSRKLARRLNRLLTVSNSKAETGN